MYFKHLMTQENVGEGNYRPQNSFTHFISFISVLSVVSGCRGGEFMI